MDISAQGIKVIEEREAVELHAYKDSRGIWTIGVGHTAAAGPPIPVPGLSITQAECDEIFHRDLAWCLTEVNSLNVPLTQYQFDALISFVFNIGQSHWRSSSTRRFLLQRNYAAAGHAMLLWNQPTEIISRRQGEYVQYMHGEYVARISHLDA